MPSRYIRTHRLLYVLVTLIIIILVIFHTILTDYWLTKNIHNSKQPLLYTQIPISKIDNSELNPPTLESPIQIVTPIPTINWNKNNKTHLPWYFKDGTKVPKKVQTNKTLPIWPEEQNDIGDRIEEQLMFVPPNYSNENATMKSILLYYGNHCWSVNDGQDEFLSRGCAVNECTITTNKSEAPNVDAIIFRNAFSHPGHEKNDNQIWILHLLESPYHTSSFINNDMINWTATYRHDSDIVTPYERWVYYNPLVTQIKQNQNYGLNKTKQVAWFVSNCNAKNQRLEYARELAKHITVDVYGECGDFKCPRSDQTCFQMLDKDYKFYLAFENSNCVDYITEKFFVNGLQHNVLPIVMGGRREDYERIAPKHSYVHVDNYESPKHLAEYLRQLDTDDDQYNEYFRWKGTGEFIDTKFFCRLCAMLHDNGAPVKYYKNFNSWWHRPDTCTNTIPWSKFVMDKIPETDLPVDQLLQ